MFQKVMRLFEKVGTIHFWGDYFDGRFFVADIVMRRKADYILDIGCGAGVLLMLTESKNRIGVEMKFESLKDAKRTDGDIQCVQADAGYLPFRDGFCPLVLTMHLFPVMKSMNAEWRNAVREIERIETDGAEILITGANRLSRHFEKSHSLEDRRAYLHYAEIMEEVEKSHDVTVEGYGPHSRAVMYPFKKIVFRIPDRILEGLRIERAICGLLKSKRFLKDGRSYVIQGRKTGAAHTEMLKHKTDDKTA